MTSIPATRPTPAIVTIWRSRFYRSSIFTLFISGIAVSSANPQLALYFVNVLHAPIAVAGLYYLTTSAAPLVGFFVGRYSDRLSDRLRLFRIGATVGAVGWILMAAATQVWMPFVISILLLSVAQATTGSQVYAAARDELSRNPTESDTKVISTIRMAFTAGWIVGPVVGAWLGAIYGLRWMLLAVAALNLLMMIPMIGVRAPRFVSDNLSERAPERLNRQTLREMFPLFAFAILCMLALSGDALKFAFLPIYMQNVLHTDPAIRGAVIATQPIFELLLIPVASAMATRFGGMKVVLVGSFFGVLAHLTYAFSTAVWQLFVGQFLMSLLWGCIAGLGVNIAQRLYRKGAGTATSTFMSTTVFASTLGGLIGSLGVTWLGLPHVFFIPAAIGTVAMIGLIILTATLSRSERASAEGGAAEVEEILREEGEPG